MGRYVVAVTGASGAMYARRLVAALAHNGHEIDLMVSAAGFLVLAAETDWDAPQYGREGGLAGRCARFFLPAGAPGRLRFHPIHDVSGPLASGGAATDGMAVIPCSMGRIAAIAAGRSADLLERCADVTLKEGRRLIVVPRETPLSLIHLRNLTTLCEAGAVVLPAMPGFYHRPRSVADLADFVVAKVLMRLGLDAAARDLVPAWDGPARPE